MRALIYFACNIVCIRIGSMYITHTYGAEWSTTSSRIVMLSPTRKPCYILFFIICIFFFPISIISSDHSEHTMYMYNIWEVRVRGSTWRGTHSGWHFTALVIKSHLCQLSELCVKVKSKFFFVFSVFSLCGKNKQRLVGAENKNTTATYSGRRRPNQPPNNLANIK